jgi:hypothetical protein
MGCFDDIGGRDPRHLEKRFLVSQAALVVEQVSQADRLPEIRHLG